MSSGLKHKDIWSLSYKGLVIEIAHWGQEEFASLLSKGEGVWNYYLIIFEEQTGDFEPLWLESKLEKFFSTSPERVTHDYMSSPIADLDWHGGISFYSKERETPGHRVIRAGCDFLHLWDEERQYKYTLEEVLAEAKITADQAVEKFKIKERA